MYRTNYANPNCKNRELKECLEGEVNEHGLCVSCNYSLRMKRADRYDDLFFRQGIKSIVFVAIVAISVVGIVAICSIIVAKLIG